MKGIGCCMYWGISPISNHRFNLVVVLSESNVDIDKVLLKLDAKDFTVEKSTLQSLQQLIQWVADLTLSILVRLPENRCNHNRGGGVSGTHDN